MPTRTNSAPDPAAFAPAAILARLDAAGVRRLVVTSSLSHLTQALYRHAPERMIPLAGVYESDRHKGNGAHNAEPPARVAARDLVLMIHGDARVVAQAFSIAPKLRVLRAHLGTQPEPDALAAMLGHFPGLWIDTSVRDARIAPGGMLLPEWRALLEFHPDRFVVAQIRGWVDPLPQPLKDNLLHDSAARLFDSFLSPPTRR